MILVDRPQWSWQGIRWSHLISDKSVAELHAFARTARLRYLSYQGDHYDVPESLFDRVTDAGAEVADSRELVRRLRGSGLRRRGAKSATNWVVLGQGQTEEIEPLLASDRYAQLGEIVATASGVKSVTVLERPGEQVGMCVLADDRVRLVGGVEIISESCVLVESDGQRGHTLEVIWGSGAGRKLDHRQTTGPK